VPYAIAAAGTCLTSCAARRDESATLDVVEPLAAVPNFHAVDMAGVALQDIVRHELDVVLGTFPLGCADDVIVSIDEK